MSNIDFSRNIQRINYYHYRAYETLGDEERRRIYDQTGMDSNDQR